MRSHEFGMAVSWLTRKPCYQYRIKPSYILYEQKFLTSYQKFKLVGITRFKGWLTILSIHAEEKSKSRSIKGRQGQFWRSTLQPVWRFGSEGQGEKGYRPYHCHRADLG
jgi:hypothetical protein